MNFSARLFLAAIALIACPLASAEQKAESTYVPDFSCLRGPYGLKLPGSYRELRRLGKLRSEKLTATEDWGKYQSHDRELRFDGLRVHVITFTDDRARYMISGIEITDRRWNIAAFRVGDSVDEARRKLKTTNSPRANQLEFGGDVDSLRFKVSPGRIVAITYGCYTG